MKPEYRRIVNYYILGLAWVFFLLWPLLGIHKNGTVTFNNVATVWLYVFAGSSICLVVYILHKADAFRCIGRPLGRVRNIRVQCNGCVAQMD